MKGKVMTLKDTIALLQAAPADPIIGISDRFQKDPRTEKVNLTVGNYLGPDGKIPLQATVHEAQRRLLERRTVHSYLPIEGLKSFCDAVDVLSFGRDSEVLLSGRSATCQAIGGTGGLYLGGVFAKETLGVSHAAVPNPTWGNHIALFKKAGLEVSQYAYYDKAAGDVNIEGLLEDLRRLPERSLVLLQVCCHNPTGYDLNEEQWKVVIEICQKGGLTPFLDMAYQGFRDGLDEDAASIRMFAASGMSFLVATSFSKSFNLYNERIGALTVVCQSKAEADVVMTQLKAVVRCNYSNPPAHGAYIVERVLSDPQKYAHWKEELGGMRERIRSMRKALADEMARLGAKRDFSFVTRQAGMFSFTGLTPEQVEKLAADYGIYAVKNGRICICGLNTRNVQYVAKSIAEVL